MTTFYLIYDHSNISPDTSLSMIYRQIRNQPYDYGCTKPGENVQYQLSTDLKIQKNETQFPQFGFQKPTLAFAEQFFTLSHSKFIFQHDSINSRCIFLHALSLQI